MHTTQPSKLWRVRFSVGLSEPRYVTYIAASSMVEAIEKLLAVNAAAEPISAEQVDTMVTVIG